MGHKAPYLVRGKPSAPFNGTLAAGSGPGPGSTTGPDLSVTEVVIMAMYCTYIQHPYMHNFISGGIGGGDIT